MLIILSRKDALPAAVLYDVVAVNALWVAASLGHTRRRPRVAESPGRLPSYVVQGALRSAGGVSRYYSWRAYAGRSTGYRPDARRALTSRKSRHANLLVGGVVLKR